MAAVRILCIHSDLSFNPHRNYSPKIASSFINIPSGCRSFYSPPSASRNLLDPSRRRPKRLTSDFLPCHMWINYDCNPASPTNHDRSSRSAAKRLRVVARLFGPAIFEASKLKVLFLGDGKDKHPEQMRRAYTLTHNDITAKLTLAVSQTINIAQLQGWYSRLQTDQVLAEWNKTKGIIHLDVHCYISGKPEGHWLLDIIAQLRLKIFRKELPVVLEAFRHGDETLFKNHPELQDAEVFVFYHSNKKECHQFENWGPLKDAAFMGPPSISAAIHKAMDEIQDELRKDIDNAATAAAAAVSVEKRNVKPPTKCPNPCKCCLRERSLIPYRSWIERFQEYIDDNKLITN